MFNVSKIEFSILTILFTGTLYIISINNYLVFHTLAENFSVVIACGIFMFIWNSRRYIENNFFLMIGIAYIFTALLDLVHTFTYKGVNVIGGITTDVPTQLWISSRYVQSLTLFAATFFVTRKVRGHYVFYSYALITILIFVSIFLWKNFPHCYIEGYGLTVFKKTSEYIISVILLLSMIFLYLKKESFDKYIFYLIQGSIILSILSELDFTLYVSVYSGFNFAGHVLKIASFYLMYKAIIVMGMENPFDILFDRLKEKEGALRLTRFSVDHSVDFILWIGHDGFITDINDTTTQILNYTREELKGLPFAVLDPDFEPDEFREDLNSIVTKDHFFIAKDGRRIPVEVEFNYIEYEGNRYFCAFARDITERKRAQEALMESEARFKSLADNAPAMIWMTDAYRKCTYCNRKWFDFTGCSPEEFRDTEWTGFIHPEDKQVYVEEFDKNFLERKENNIEYRLRRYDGQYRWILDLAIPRFTSDGSFLGYMGSGYDITESRESREQMKLSLSEKVTQLKEIHHRVKNNLQIVSSLLQLQSSYIRDDNVRQIFMESRNRVRSMAFIHEKLYLSKDLKHINFPEYIRELVSGLLSSCKSGFNDIDIEIEIDDIQIDADTAINLGLIVNELVTNVFKYAFPDGRSKHGNKCELIITIKDLSDGKFILIVRDNGIGLPSNVDFRNTSTLGLQLVTVLVEQLKGKIELKEVEGTEYYITF